MSNIQFPQEVPNIEHKHTEDTESSDNVIEIYTSYRNISSIEIVDTSTPPHVFRFNNSMGENNCWLNHIVMYATKCTQRQIPTQKY